MKLLNLWRKKVEDGGTEIETFKSTDGNKTLILSFDKKLPCYLGLTICQTKRIKKFLNWDYLLFNKEELKQKLIPAFLAKDEDSRFAECDCLGEVLRIKYDKDENTFSLDIFDNWFYQNAKKGLEDSIEISYDDATRLRRTLSIYANAEME
jgi:hypothetical protein